MKGYINLKQVKLKAKHKMKQIPGFGAGLGGS
jgi:hypothetical protein